MVVAILTTQMERAIRTIARETVVPVGATQIARGLGGAAARRGARKKMTVIVLAIVNAPVLKLPFHLEVQTHRPLVRLMATSSDLSPKLLGPTIQPRLLLAKQARQKALRKTHASNLECGPARSHRKGVLQITMDRRTIMYWLATRRKRRRKKERALRRTGLCLVVVNSHRLELGPPEAGKWKKLAGMRSRRRGIRI